ncbi:MAG: (deoxy)nucleoside triphosphate pyrophosphohydrolase [Candidatus Merdivicinus sp.]|jgi:mutator protein MutT
MTEVVAALIWKEGRFLIAQRPASKTLAFLWEFVGGKVEPGETKEEALIRECQEELGITVEPEDLFLETVYTYPDITVHLSFFRASIREGIPQQLEHQEIRWIMPEEIEQYPFCPADRDILAYIKQNFHSV